MFFVCLFFSSRTTSLPPLDWPLPSQFGQYELKIEVQPKAHHRAHYETEGSRGAVKAASGGHPIVKVSLQILGRFSAALMSLPTQDLTVRGNTITTVH